MDDRRETSFSRWLWRGTIAAVLFLVLARWWTNRVCRAFTMIITSLLLMVLGTLFSNAVAHFVLIGLGIALVAVGVLYLLYLERTGALGGGNDA